MNYLVVEGYREAAAAFARESGIEEPRDLGCIDARMKVRAWFFCIFLF
jgi:hypothetical protein